MGKEGGTCRSPSPRGKGNDDTDPQTLGESRRQNPPRTGVMSEGLRGPPCLHAMGRKRGFFLGGGGGGSYWGTGHYASNVGKDIVKPNFRRREAIHILHEEKGKGPGRGHFCSDRREKKADTALPTEPDRKGKEDSLRVESLLERGEEAIFAAAGTVTGVKRGGKQGGA